MAQITIYASQGNHQDTKKTGTDFVLTLHDVKTILFKPNGIIIYERRNGDVITQIRERTSDD